MFDGNHRGHVADAFKWRYGSGDKLEDARSELKGSALQKNSFFGFSHRDDGVHNQLECAAGVSESVIKMKNI